MNPVAAQAKKDKKRQLQKNAAKRAAQRQEKLATKSSEELRIEIERLDRAAKAHAAATGGREHHQALDQKKKLEKELQVKLEAERIQLLQQQRHQQQQDEEQQESQSSKRAKLSSSQSAVSGSSHHAATSLDSAPTSAKNSLVQSRAEAQIKVVGMSSIIGQYESSDSESEVESESNQTHTGPESLAVSTDYRCSADVPAGYLLLSPPAKQDHASAQAPSKPKVNQLWRIQAT